MISFYGGPNGVQGIQGIQGNKGDAFKIYTVVEGNINSYIFSDSDKANYNSDNGAWLGLYDKSDNQHKFYIMQWQFLKPPVSEEEKREREGKQESFLLGILNNPLWYILKDNKLMVSNEHIFLTRDQNGVLSESGQLDFTISDNSLKISTKTDDGDKIYISPKSYDLDKENGYLTVNNIFDAYPIGDVKIRAIPDNGILTGEGKKWIDFTDGATFITQNKTFLNTLNYKNCGLIDPESNDIQLSLETFKEIYKDVTNTYNLEKIYNNGLKPLTIYNNQVIYIFELKTNEILSILYYNLSNFANSNHIEINKNDNSDAFDFWGKYAALERHFNKYFYRMYNYYKDGAGYQFVFYYSAITEPLNIYSINLDDLYTRNNRPSNTDQGAGYNFKSFCEKPFLLNENTIYFAIEQSNGSYYSGIITNINNKEKQKAYLLAGTHAKGNSYKLDNNIIIIVSSSYQTISFTIYKINPENINSTYYVSNEILGGSGASYDGVLTGSIQKATKINFYQFNYNNINYFIISLLSTVVSGRQSQDLEKFSNCLLFSFVDENYNFIKRYQISPCNFLNSTELNQYKKFIPLNTSYSPHLDSYQYDNNNYLVDINSSIYYYLTKINGIINDILIFQGHIIKLTDLINKDTPYFIPLPLNFYAKFYDNDLQLVNNEYYNLPDGNFHSIKNDIYNYIDKINYLVYPLGLDNFYSYLKIK